MPRWDVDELTGKKNPFQNISISLESTQQHTLRGDQNQGINACQKAGKQENHENALGAQEAANGSQEFNISCSDSSDEIKND